MPPAPRLAMPEYVCIAAFVALAVLSAGRLVGAPGSCDAAEAN